MSEKLCFAPVTRTCSVAGGLSRYFRLLLTFFPNSPRPHDHLSGIARYSPRNINCREGRLRGAQGLRDQTRVTGHGGAGRATFCAQGLSRGSRPGRAGDGDRPAFFPHAGSRSPGPVRPPRPAPSHAGPRRGWLWRRGRERGRRLTHAYIRPSASSTPSPPYRGTCVQQPRHIRAGPARPLRRPRLLPGRAGSRPQMHPGRARG